MNASAPRVRFLSPRWLSLLLVVIGHVAVLAWIWSRQAEALLAVSESQPPVVMVQLQAPVPVAEVRPPPPPPAPAPPPRRRPPPAKAAPPEPEAPAAVIGAPPAAAPAEAGPSSDAAQASAPTAQVDQGTAAPEPAPADTAAPAQTGPVDARPTAAAEPSQQLAGLSDGLYAVPLAPFVARQTLSFDVHVPKDYQESGASGSAQVLFESGRDDSGRDTYRIDIDIKPNFGLRLFVGGNLRYQSNGLLGRNGPQTLRYSEKVGNRAERWLEVERPRREMKSAQIASLMLPPGAQDRLSVIGLLSMLARSDPAQLDKGKVFSVPMFSFRQVYTARFESFGPAVLESPAGILQTLHVGYRVGGVDGDKVDLWLGYDVDMQPVRIRWQEAQGRVIDLILQKKP